MARKTQRGGLVYTTGQGRMCPACRRPTTECVCAKQQPRTTGDGVVRVGRETKGRRGKGVTVITGLPLQGGALRDLAKSLKQRCGTGGTVKDGVIELQGEHRDTLVALLTQQGYVVKRSGG